MFTLKAEEPGNSPVFLPGLKGGFCLTQIGSTLFTVSWNVLFSILRATAAGLNRCLCCASCRVDSARFPSGGARPRVQLDGQAPPLWAGWAHSWSFSGGDWKSSTGKRLKTEGEALAFIFFFFDSLKAFVGCHFVSADESAVQPSGCNNIRQAQFTVCIKGAVTLQECFSGGDGTI